MHLIIALLIANSVAHIVSYGMLRKAKADNAGGVLAFVFINAAIAALLSFNIEWAKWLALAFPAIGGLGLFVTTIVKGKGTWIDYMILILDIVLVALIIKFLVS